jgi:hypothetical protein
MPLVNFSEQNFAPFPSIFARILKLEHFRGDWAYAEPNFFGEISNNFFLQKVHFGPIRWCKSLSPHPQLEYGQARIGLGITQATS